MTDSAAVLAAHSPAQVSFFTWIMRRRMARTFHAVRMANEKRPEIPAGHAAIVYSNHPAWWDPAFFIVLMGRLFPQARGFGPMEAEALERYGFMRRIGIFGIDTERFSGAARFLRITRGLLADADNMLWLTAQGVFSDPRTRPTQLRAGVARLMTLDRPLVAIPLALEYPFWSESRPEALCRFGTPLIAAPDTPANWQTRLEMALTETQDALRADAVSRDAARFRTLVRGSSGVGGVYDLGRRLRAALRGERFSAEHTSEDKRR